MQASIKVFLKVGGGGRVPGIWPEYIVSRFSSRIFRRSTRGLPQSEKALGRSWQEATRTFAPSPPLQNASQCTSIHPTADINQKFNIDDDEVHIGLIHHPQKITILRVRPSQFISGARTGGLCVYRQLGEALPTKRRSRHRSHATLYISTFSPGAIFIRTRF